MTDARYGMLAHVKHISLHLEQVLNFSLSILHIPASNLREIVTVGYDYERESVLLIHLNKLWKRCKFLHIFQYQ